MKEIQLTQGKVDHRNGNGLDNQKDNLRVCTRLQNARSFASKRKNASSKFRGVSRDFDREKWFADIRVLRKTIHLGRYEQEEDAAKAYDAAAKIYFGEFASPNFSN